MRFRLVWALMLVLPTTVFAAPGVGDPVYGATVIKGVTEFEARYGRLMGGAEDGADGLVLEAEHAFSNQFAGAVLVETGRDGNGQRSVNSASIEAIHTLGRVDALALDVALYAEYKYGFRGNSDVLEGKVLLEHRAATFDARLNVISEHALQHSAPVDLSYAASVDWAVIGNDLRLGVAAFGDLGSTQHFGGRQEHFAGPEIKIEVDHFGSGELEVEAGWLRAFGAARDRTQGQARLLISYEMHF